MVFSLHLELSLGTLVLTVGIDIKMATEFFALQNIPETSWYSYIKKPGTANVIL